MLIIKLGMLFCYLHISAMGTTDITRLLKGSKYSVMTFNSYCDNCGHKLPLVFQIPILSFLFNKGRCRYCEEKIKISNLLLELIPFLYYSAISFIFNFQDKSVVICFASYEILKIVLVAFYGKKEDKFLKEYTLSIFLNIMIFLMVGFLSLLNSMFIYNL